MRCLSLQVQPELDSACDVDALIKAVRSIGRYPEVDRHEGGGKYIQLHFFSENVAKLWAELKAGVFDKGEIASWLKKVAIVVCEGEADGDDELLLYHHDHNEELDTL